MKVLIAIDGSEPALRAFRNVASLLVPKRDEVRLLTVLSYTDYPYTDFPGEHLVDEGEREQYVREKVHHLTDEPRRLLEEIGLRVGIVHRFGNPTEEIVGVIDEWLPDLVVLGRRGVHGLERILGSVSERVLHHSKVPVLLVP
ncbi:MAG TPA: universal stress protein [Actinomycetota bacterium]|nr:universal stress protein [Actinomycetota bacterium]